MDSLPFSETMIRHAAHKIPILWRIHRIHHSVRYHEMDNNYGFNFAFWDRLFGTYRDQPEKGHDAMTIGIDLFRDPGELHLPKMLAQPFVEAAGDYPINRRDWEKTNRRD